MGYDYQKEKADLLTEDGQEMLMKVYDTAQALLKKAGAFRASESWKDVTGSTWMMLACLDRLVELGRIREVTDPAKVWGQHRVFVAANNDA